MLDLNLKDKAEREGWGDHPYTQHLLRYLESDSLPRARRELYGACSISADPKVREKLAELNTVEELLRFIKKSGRDTDAER